MKKEEQIKQLKNDLDILLKWQKNMENYSSDEEYLVRIMFTAGTKLITKLTKKLESLKGSEVEEESIPEGGKKLMNLVNQCIYSPIPDFSDVVITHFLGKSGELVALGEYPINTHVENFGNLEYLGEDEQHRLTFKATDKQGNLVLFFGKREEKQLKHPHMKGITAVRYLQGDLKVCIDGGTSWEDYDKVEIIGEDRWYGTIVKATIDIADPNQFILYFCKKDIVKS